MQTSIILYIHVSILLVHNFQSLRTFQIPLRFFLTLQTKCIFLFDFDEENFL